MVNSCVAGFSIIGVELLTVSVETGAWRTEPHELRRVANTASKRSFSLKEIVEC